MKMGEEGIAAVIVAVIVVAVAVVAAVGGYVVLTRSFEV